MLIVLVALGLTMAVPAGAATTDTYRPNSDISISSEIHGNGGGPQCNFVNDSDDGSFLLTFFHNVANDWHVRSIWPSQSQLLDGITAINSVTVWARVSREAFAESGSQHTSARTLLGINGTNYGGSGFFPPNAGQIYK